MADAITRTLAGAGAGAIGVIGGSRLANEDAYAWVRLAKGVIGTDNFDAQLGDGLPAELVASLPRATIEETIGARTVVVLAGDLREELPVLHLRLRQAAANSGLRILDCSPVASGLSEVATGAPTERRGRSSSPRSSSTTRAVRASSSSSAAHRSPSRRTRSQPRRPCLPPLGRRPFPLGAAARQCPWRHRPRLCSWASSGTGVAGGRSRLVRRALGLGARRTRARHCRRCSRRPQSGELRTLVLLGADPLSDFPDRDLATRALEQVEFLVSVDTILNASSMLADVVLPAAGFAERGGTTTNIEGRVLALPPRWPRPAGPGRLGDRHRARRSAR